MESFLYPFVTKTPMVMDDMNPAADPVEAEPAATPAEEAPAEAAPEGEATEGTPAE